MYRMLRQFRRFGTAKRYIYPTNWWSFGNGTPNTKNLEILTRPLAHVSQQTTRKPSIVTLVEQIDKHKRVSLELVRNAVPNMKFEDVSEDQAVLILNCCGAVVPNATKDARNEVCRLIFGELTAAEKLTIDVCHAYIRACTENGVALNLSTFRSIGCEPNRQTYKLLLGNACEKGDVAQAIDVLTAMKDRQMLVDEDNFNALVLAHTIKGGLEGARTVLHTMKAALVPETRNTTFSILKGLAVRNDEKEFLAALQRHGFEFVEDEFLQVLEKIGLNGNEPFLSKVLQLGKRGDSKESILKIDHLCIHLINMQQPESAMVIYESLVDPVPEKKYAHFLLREMLVCRTPVDKVLETVKRIRDAGSNPHVVENTTEIVLRLKIFDIALDFFNHLTCLRPHFFWPLLVNAGRNEGELGVFSMLREMTGRNVKADSETLDTYVIPYCNLDEPKLVVKSLQKFGFTVRELLPPLLVVLLRTRRLELAKQICETYDVQIQSHKLLTLLAPVWKETKDTATVIGLLQRICEANVTENDLVGDFLTRCLKECKDSTDFRSYLKLIGVVSDKKLRIHPTSSDVLHGLVSSKCQDDRLAANIKSGLDNLQDMSKQTEVNAIPHPRNMDTEQLECHLEELKHKGMETRGLLRKLIQRHCNLGNFERVAGLREEFRSAGYGESAGMKSTLMYSCVQQGSLDAALQLYEELRADHPGFRVDSFKAVDLAAAMVRSGRFEEAVDLLTYEADKKKVFGGRGLERNCWRLLGAIGDGARQAEMFDCLVRHGYCEPTNVILGPLIRSHLNSGDLKNAVERFISITSEYKRTPLQLELLCAIIEANDPECLQKVFEAIENVHGPVGASLGLIAALAEKGRTNSLKKFILTRNSIPGKELLKRCDRWVEEGKAEPLLTLERALRNASAQVVDRNRLYSSIMKVYSFKNDCESALAFYEDLLEDDALISKELEEELCNLLTKCNYAIPSKFKTRFGK